MKKEHVEELDKAICKLESMGTILTQLATNEGQELELSSLADLGRIIQSLAMEALDLTTEIEVSEVNNDHQAQETPSQIQDEVSEVNNDHQAQETPSQVQGQGGR
jgi:hypothetical protein